MRNPKVFVSAAIFAAMVTVAVAPVRAQGNPTAPVAIRNSSGTTTAKAVWLKAEIVRADRHTLIVREQANPLAIHTFTYAQGLQPFMEKIADQGGYQFGDKVQVYCVPGQTVALKVRGKPSKSP